MSDAVKRVSAEISGSEISGSRDFQTDNLAKDGPGLTGELLAAFDQPAPHASRP